MLFRGGISLNKKKQIGCYAPLELSCHPIYPPCPPQPNPGCELVSNEFSGNFLVRDGQVQTLQLWKSDGITSISGTVSVYNSSNSTDPATIVISGISTTTLIVLPGNTSSFTGTDLQSVEMIDIPNTSLSYLEGKYCCQFTYCHSKSNRV